MFPRDKEDEERILRELRDDERRRLQEELKHPTPKTSDFMDNVYSKGLAIIVLVIIAVVVASFITFLFYSGLFEFYDETTKIFETPEETIERYDELIEDNKDAKGDIFNPSKWMKDIATDKKENLEFEINATYDDWISKGMSLANLGKYDQAIQHFDKAIEIDPDEHLAWVGKGRILEVLDKNEEAIQAYDRALELNPNYTNVEQRKNYLESLIIQNP